MSTEPTGALSHRQAGVLAAKYGLRKTGARPGPRTYVRQLWRRRFFAWTLASSDAYGRNQGNYLGQLWSVLNPVLQMAVFWFVFGYVLTGTREGTGDFVAFLAIGTFLFNFMSTGLNAGARAITNKIALVRALEFPRAVLPISVTLTEMILTWPALIVMIGIVALRHQTITWSWLLLPVAVLLLFVFVLGCSFIAARICSSTPDLANLVPVTTQLLRFLSGVFFSIAALAAHHGPVLRGVLHYQPFSLYLSIARQALMDDFPIVWGDWLAAAGWAGVTVVVGAVFFWKAEARYGRD